MLIECEKYRQIDLQLVTIGDGIANLDVPLATSVGSPMSNKKAKLAVIIAASSDRVQALIDKCIPDVSSNFLIRGLKE
jgi:hypothetical protein